MDKLTTPTEIIDCRANLTLETTKEGTSYGELAVLSDMFDKEIEERYIVFPHEDARTGAWMDFCEQYENGNMTPHIELCDGAREMEVYAFGERVPAIGLQSMIDNGMDMDEITTEYIESEYGYDFYNNLKDSEE